MLFVLQLTPLLEESIQKPQSKIERLQLLIIYFCIMDWELSRSHTSVFYLRENTFDIKSMVLITVVSFIKKVMLALKCSVWAQLELCNKSYLSLYNGTQDC